MPNVSLRRRRVREVVPEVIRPDDVAGGVALGENGAATREFAAAARPPTDDIVIPPEEIEELPSRRDWGWFPAVALLCSVMLALVTLGHAASRSGRSYGEIPYWIGLAIPILVVAYRQAVPRLDRAERLSLVVLLGLFFYLVKVTRDPFLFTFADEFIASHNSEMVLNTKGLFSPDVLLPATRDYPGIASDDGSGRLADAPLDLRRRADRDGRRAGDHVSCGLPAPGAGHEVETARWTRCGHVLRGAEFPLLHGRVLVRVAEPPADDGGGVHHHDVGRRRAGAATRLGSGRPAAARGGGDDAPRDLVRDRRLPARGRRSRCGEPTTDGETRRCPSQPRRSC